MEEFIQGLLIIIVALLVIVFVILPLAVATFLIGLLAGCMQGLAAWCVSVWRQCIAHPDSTTDVSLS